MHCELSREEWSRVCFMKLNLTSTKREIKPTSFKIQQFLVSAKSLFQLRLTTVLFSWLFNIPTMSETRNADEPFGCICQR